MIRKILLLKLSFLLPKETKTANVINSKKETFIILNVILETITSEDSQFFREAMNLWNWFKLLLPCSTWNLIKIELDVKNLRIERLYILEYVMSEIGLTKI